MNTKQVIVIRKDLNMRKGKMCAQASHASMAFITKGAAKIDPLTNIKYFSFLANKNGTTSFCFANHEEIHHWLSNSFRKISVYVNSEEELKEVHQKALDEGLISHIIEDNGATEFNGVKTLTCCAIGPHLDDKFEGITDHLPLL